MKIITRTVWLLSLVSLFTDIASEMLYPVIPVYLSGLGYSVLLIGVLEGFAEAVAGLSKGYFGKLSDTFGKRLPFVRFGYALSAISKPMMGLFAFPLWIFAARTIDRIGKGVRTGARDALLSDESTPETKGKVFGFHRGVDTFGAVLGPVAALVYLYFFPHDYRTLFFIAFFPGAVSIAFTFFIKEKAHPPSGNKARVRFLDFIKYWRSSPGMYKQLVSGLLLFALINSSDMFLILQVKAAGFSDTQAIGVYIFYNLVYAVFSYQLGRLGDRIGLKKVFLIGLAVFAIVYFGMALSTGIVAFFCLFFIYGIYTAATEGISKAWITNVTDRKDTATAIGAYTAFQSICTLAASSLAGWVWFAFGAQALFVSTGIATLLLLAYFMAVVRGR